jgi:hypothetical protein
MRMRRFQQYDVNGWGELLELPTNGQGWQLVQWRTWG